MKRAFLLILSLILLFGMSACSVKYKEDADSKFQQKEIPEEYRLKVNIPDYWNDPLPSAEADFVFPLFGLGSVLDGEQPGKREPLDIPSAEDLFTVEEVGKYFDMIVRVKKKDGSFTMENETTVTYYLYKTEPSEYTFPYGVANFWISDWGDPMTASATMSVFDSDSREIKDLGKRAFIDKLGGIRMLATNTVIIGVSLEFDPPEGGPRVPAEEEDMLKFARLVYDRFMEKMK